ncbi:MAG: TetR family transcriptional regulator [Deltaproteobacteria bacterium]
MFSGTLPLRGRPPKDPARDTRQALLDAGLELFAMHGFHGTSLRQIAQAVGVRESALYNHFDSKEALFHAIVADGEASRNFEFERVLSRPVKTARATLIHLGEAVIARASTLREGKLFRIMMSDGLRLALEGKVDFFERTGSSTGAFALVMEKLVREGWLVRARPDFLAMEFGAPFIVWRHIHAIHPDHPSVASPKAFIEAHVNHFLQGAAAPGKDR